MQRQTGVPRGTGPSLALLLLPILLAACGSSGAGGGGGAASPSPTRSPTPGATRTVPSPVLSPPTAPPSRTTTPAPAATGTAVFTPTAAATISPTSAPPGSPTPRGEQVAGAATPAGVVGELPGTRVGGSPSMPAQYRVTAPPEVAVETFVSGLVVPWSMAFAPDGRLFVSERPGRIRLVENGGLDPQPWAVLAVRASGEGGLMGLALDPEFPAEPWVYVCYTISRDGETRNRISRLREVEGQGGEEQILLDAFPGASVHDGCRLGFGPDGKLYATTGDAASRSLAQELDSLAGKILRLNRDGTPPGDNPFGETSLLWAFGNRNPQGLAFDPMSGALVATEHGPSGEIGIGGHDEVNVIAPGANYGWPRVIGAPGLAEFADPLLLYREPAVAPAGATFYFGAAIPSWRGNFFFATLRGQHLQRIVLDESRTAVVAIERLFETGTSRGLFGRLRDVIEGPDGALYLATSNRDGRGTPGEGDDRILRLRGTD